MFPLSTDIMREVVIIGKHLEKIARELEYIRKLQTGEIKKKKEGEDALHSTSNGKHS